MLLVLSASCVIVRRWFSYSHQVAQAHVFLNICLNLILYVISYTFHFHIYWKLLKTNIESDTQCDLLCSWSDLSLFLDLTTIWNTLCILTFTSHVLHCEDAVCLWTSWLSIWYANMVFSELKCGHKPFKTKTFKVVFPAQ